MKYMFAWILGNFRDTEFSSCLKPKMAVHDLAVGAGKHWDLEAEFTDAAAHAIHCCVVLAWVAGVENKPVDGPDFHLQVWTGLVIVVLSSSPLNSSWEFHSSTDNQTIFRDRVQKRILSILSNALRSDNAWTLK
jgi:hypothetical protein